MTTHFDRAHQTLKSMNLPVDFWSIKRVEEKVTHWFFRNEKPETNSKSIDIGYMIEVMVNGHFSYAGTSDLTEDGIRRAAHQAVENGNRYSQIGLAKFPLSVRPANQGKFISPRKSSLDTLSKKEFSDILVQACKELKTSSKIIETYAGAMMIQTDFQNATSHGAHIHQSFDLISTDFRAIAQEKTETQTRTHNGMRANCIQAGTEAIKPQAIFERCRTIGHEAEQLLFAENCPTGEMDLLLAPDVMLIQIHESIGHPLEIDRILGDERNYAGWSFVQPKDFGTLKYGSHLMNITFDPTVAGEFASYAYDESGAKAEKLFLIENGILKRGLGGLESQFRSQIPGVSNFRSSSWNRAPIDRMANINMEAGTESLEQIIARTEKGILMNSNCSWSIDDYRNKFQFGNEFGQEIKDGKLGQIYKNPNYRGSTVKFWNSLTGVSNADTLMSYGSPYCGKGEPNQVIRVGHRAPYCLFKDISVFGGGK
ncbi:MAG: TldD/PmbA family protein [Pseudobdellovibrionaceae bacterium]